VGGSVAAFINLYLPKLHRAGYIAPNRPEDGGLASPGGYVMSSKPGLYKHVLVLDFKSLYPSIMRTFKIDPLGLVEGLLSPEQAIEGYRGAKFSRDKHFLPDIITSLWQQRDEAKKNQDAARSQAIKILMNSFYGVLGSGGCPFYDTRLASSITMRGHDIMLTTAKWIEQAGYQVIYGDTDSTFVWLDGEYSNQQAAQIGQSLAININQKWQQNILQDHNLHCDLEIEFETHYSQFLMPTIRGSELGSKKRYAGLKITTDGDELVFKGLETVRSDWTQLAKNFQLTLYKMVFGEQNVNAYLLQIIEDARSGKLDEQLVYHKRIRRKLELYVKNVPPHVKAARLADQQNKLLGKKLRYQHKSWISYVITINGPEPVEYLTSQIDYEHYVDKQIKPIAEGILPFIGLSFEDITSQQMGLFQTSSNML
jgi:DNA polymerase-2